MSEGINFSDDLARAVILIGLPFSNIQSIEIKSKLTYLEEKYRDKVYFRIHSLS
jgi:chromosome transmission fidelity protein 1